MKSRTRILLPVAGILLFLLGWYGHTIYTYRSGDAYTRLTKIIREDSVQYTFTKPLLFIDNAEAVFPELDPLRNKIHASIDKVEKKGKVTGVSVYFRDLTTTRWTGIEEEKLYDPASMLKVALLISYLHLAEKNPAILSKKLYYTGDADTKRYYRTASTLEKEKYYTIQELLVDMIVKSGNDSTAVLFKNADMGELIQLHKDLDLSLLEENTPELLSAKDYSRLFRVLFSSTYLGRQLSEQVLELLSQTEFTRGLKAQLPHNVLVAHKFGELSSTKNGTIIERQLHDCGIIYQAEHPYFLCVMTKGTDFGELEKVIADISKITYHYWETVQK